MIHCFILIIWCGFHANFGFTMCLNFSKCWHVAGVPLHSREVLIKTEPLSESACAVLRMFKLLDITCFTSSINPDVGPINSWSPLKFLSRSCQNIFSEFFQSQSWHCSPRVKAFILVVLCYPLVGTRCVQSVRVLGRQKHMLQV